jgi:redox-sensing transcriptional repressor
VATRGRIPEATVTRLPIYLRSLLELAVDQVPTVSSERLAELAGVNAAKVRKDLSYLGSYGTRGVGYDVGFLVDQVGRELGMSREWPVVIVGLGNLGRALANYRGFTNRGFRVAALLDVDPVLVGEEIAGLTVHGMDQLEEVVAAAGVSVGIVATVASAAQDVADRLVAAGVKAILNFAPTVINVPGDVSLRKVDLSIELQVLTFYQHQQSRSCDPATR